MTATPDTLDPAQLAKAALRRLALSRQEPTPGNYARAWREEGGPIAEPEAAAPAPRAAATAVQALVRRLLPAGEAREALAAALQGGRWDEVRQRVEADVPAPDQQGRAWAELIERCVRGTQRASKAWPVGRRRDSLQHVLEASRSDPQRLQQRLLNLLGSWDGGEAVAQEDEALSAPERAAETSAPDGEGPVAAALAAVADAVSNAAPLAAGPASAQAALAQVACAVAPDAAPTALAPPVVHWPAAIETLEGTLRAALPPGEPRAGEVGERLQQASAALRADPGLAQRIEELDAACGEVRRVLQHRHHLVDQLGGLVRELTDGLGELAEDDSWVEGQCLAMREQLGLGLSPRGVSAVSQLLAVTRTRQQQLRQERNEARETLKSLIHRMLSDIGELGEHTGRFNDQVGRYARVIGEADSLESLAGIVREMVDETRTVHSLVSQTTRRLHEEHASATAMAERVRQLEAELRQLSMEVGTDQLTQVANRRGLIRLFEVESARVEREAAVLAVGLLDIDNFKKLNDTLGHATGDEALKFLARRVGETLRPTDVLARYGGEEFVVLLPGTPIEEAQQVLTRVQRLMSAELFMHENKQTFVTFSAGVTPFRAGETLEAALQRADEALYEAKRTGKNRTCVA